MSSPQVRRRRRAARALSVYSNRALLAHVGEHQGDVRREQVVHLVAEQGVAEQLGAAHQIADGHVEVRVARRPVGDARERVRDENVL